MKQTFFTLLFSSLVLLSKGQILRLSDLYYDSGITKVERKGLNEGGIGKDYKTIYELDSIGRTIERKSFRKDLLLLRTHYTYNSNNDVTFVISYNDITDPHKSDTLQYSYKYNNGKIVFQKEILYRGDSTIYRMIENKGDSIFIYEVSPYHYLNYKKTNHQIDNTLILTCNNTLLTKVERVGEDGSKQITLYEYYENRDLKRRVLKIFSTSDIKQMLIGAPGADDQTYKYSYDKKGRIKDYYLIRNRKKYKFATYRYE